MNIECYLLSNGEFEEAKIPKELLTELCQSLRENGTTPVHFATRSINVEGIYIPAKGSKNIMVITKGDE